VPVEASFAEFRAFDHFARVVDDRVFEPVPGDHWLGLSDVVCSTAAIAAGRYKAVNMAGAAVISAVMNAIGSRSFPFVFGGDGASYVVAAEHLEAVRSAAAATATFVSEELGLELRVALAPVSAIREAGHDLRVARFAASPFVAYAMFSGGGVEWAERQMKEGRFLLPPAPARSRPDLTGLSCRWKPLQSRHGTILSLIVREAPGAPPGRFARLVEGVIAIIDGSEERHGQPVAPEGPEFGFVRQGLDYEARASRRRQPLFARKAYIWLEMLYGIFLSTIGRRAGRFDPSVYRRVTALNTDFRKFDDGLKMTVDCHEGTADRIEQLLADAEARGIARYGMHRQSSALMTCIVPSYVQNDHLHFLDGAGGGYAAAAARLK
jgi:hypothetical protein